MDLHKLDLNLLLVFDAILAHQSVTKAASELHMSQSTLSHALSRLRESLDDPLFIRSQGKMYPTPRGAALAEPIAQAIQTLNSALAVDWKFSPETSSRQFVVASTDYISLVILPPLLEKLNQLNNISIKLVQLDKNIPAKEMAQGKIDLSLGFEHRIHKLPEINQQQWFEDHYSTVLRQNHPSITNGEMTIDSFLSLYHVLISPWHDNLGIVDEALAKEGLTRKIAVTVPHVLTAPYLIPNSDLVLTCPNRLINMLQPQLNLQVFQPPISLPKYHFNMYWHKRFDKDPGLLWLRKQLMSAASSLV